MPLLSCQRQDGYGPHTAFIAAFWLRRRLTVSGVSKALVGSENGPVNHFEAVAASIGA